MIMYVVCDEEDVHQNTAGTNRRSWFACVRIRCQLNVRRQHTHGEVSSTYVQKNRHMSWSKIDVNVIIVVGDAEEVLLCMSTSLNTAHKNRDHNQQT